MSGAVLPFPYTPATSWRVKGQSCVCGYRNLGPKSLFLTARGSVSYKWRRDVYRIFISFSFVLNLGLLGGGGGGCNGASSRQRRRKRKYDNNYKISDTQTEVASAY
jgi:hypothetical protein